MSSSARWCVALALIFIAFFVLRVVLPGEAPLRLGDDVYLYYYPFYEASYGALARGEWPIWNPWQLTGLPWLATLQGGLLYPLHVVYLVLPTHVAMGVLAAFHLLLALFATLWFARRAGLPDAAAALAGVLFAMRGSTSFLLHFPNMLEAAAWLPVGCIAVQGLARGEGARAVGLLALAAAMSVFAGYPQLTVYSAYAWGGVLILLLAFERRPLERWARSLAGLLAGGLLGGLIAAPQLFPAIELAMHGTRSLGEISLARMFPLGIRLLGLGESLIAALQQREVFPVLPLSLGAIGLALLPGSLLSHRTRVVGLVGLVVAGVTLGFAVGPVNPLFSLYLELPLLGVFRAPARILVLTDFGLALAAGAGLAAFSQAQPRAVWRRARLWLCLVSLGIAVWLASSGSPTSAAVALALAALAAGVEWATHSTRAGDPPRAGWISPSAIGALVLALGLAELFLAAPNRYRLAYSDPGYLEVFRERRAVYQRVRGPERVWIANSGAYPRLPSKLASVFELRSIDDYEPANLGRQAEYFRFLMRGPRGLEATDMPYTGRLVAPDANELVGFVSRSRLLDLASVRFLLAPAKPYLSQKLREFVQRGGWKRVDAQDPEVVLFENPRALPRAYTTYRMLPAPPMAELLARLSQRDFDPMRQSYLEGRPVATPLRGAPERGAEAHIALDRGQRVVVEAELAAPGWLVLADSWFPGWVASVDGERVEIRRVNHLFRAVALPAGIHVVEFRYRPASLAWGIGASLAALPLCAFLLRSPTRREQER